MPYVWINNEFVEESAASVPLNDAAFWHGAGVFTTMQARNGRSSALTPTWRACGDRVITCTFRLRTRMLHWKEAAI